MYEEEADLVGSCRHCVSGGEGGGEEVLESTPVVLVGFFRSRLEGRPQGGVQLSLKLAGCRCCGMVVGRGLAPNRWRRDGVTC